MVASLSRILVRVAAQLVPERERSEWKLEWESEIWHQRRERALQGKLDWRGEMKLFRRSLGAFADAMDVRGSSSLREGLGSDLRYGLRMLRKSPGFTLVTVLLLALGIGATTAIFSVVHAVLLKDLPFRDPERLVLVWEQAYKRDKDRNVVGPSNYLKWHERARSFEALSAFVPWAANLTGEGEPERVPIGVVSHDFFTTLGIDAARGRVFTPEDGTPGHNDVVVLGDGLWKRRFGADPDVVGKTLQVDGSPKTVVGVLPPGIEFPAREAGQGIQLWGPFAFTEAHRQSRGRYLLVVGRLAPGVSLEQAQDEMKRIASDLEREDPDFDVGWSANVFPLQPELVRDVRSAVLLVFAAVAGVLLIACANVGSLLLTRAVARERELSVRAALGAHRLRILRQLLVESLLLAAVGALTGLFLAKALLQALLAWIPAELPAFIHIGIDGTVLAFTLVVALGTSLVFGLLPAIQVSRRDLVAPLKDGARGDDSLRKQRLKNGLVVLEMGLAVLLLVVVGLLIRSFLTLSKVKPGFEPRNLTAIELNLSGSRYNETAAQTTFYQEALARLSSLAGVESAGAISWMPLGGAGSATSYRVADKPDPPPEEPRIAEVRIVDGDLFRAMRIPLVEGRLLDERDRADSRVVVVVNQTLASEVWPGESAIGKTVLMSWGDELEAEVVGVVGDVRLSQLDTAPRATLYWSQAQLPNSFMTLMVRAKERAHLSSAELKSEIAAVDPEIPASRISSMEEVVNESLGRPRITLALMSAFGAAALLLAAIGIYGVLAFQVSQRGHEIGLRMALGASASDIAVLVLRQGLHLALLGVGLGLGGALLVSRFVEGLLYEVAPRDPLTLVVIPLMLIAVALLASYVPARRASRIDPYVTLRTE